MIIDITPPITPTSAVWPGDTPPSREVLLDVAQGDTVTLSTLHSTVHLGAHADAPSHYHLDGRTIDTQPLDLYVGACEVMHVEGVRGGRVGIDDLPSIPRAPRLLIATGTFDGFEAWNDDFCGLEPKLVDHLATCGVRLVGVDTPSVDLMNDQMISAHQRFYANDMAILEGLALGGIPAGAYELFALPLNLVGFDASPIRAILRTVES